MTRDYDQEFGPGSIYEWPADPNIAERLIETALYKKSSSDCLNDYFFSRSLSFLDAHLFEDFQEDKALELAKAAAKARQELFKEAKEWPLNYLVTSAIYNILSTGAEQIYMVTDLWIALLWPFLTFDEPLFGMLRSKNWGRVYGNKIRKGFKFRLSFEIGGLTGNRLMWGTDKDQPKEELEDQFKEKPWFTCEGFTSHIYAEDVLRCLDLVGIDPGLAQLAVDQVFQLQSLTPLYDVLSDDHSSILINSIDES